MNGMEVPHGRPYACLAKIDTAGAAARHLATLEAADLMSDEATFNICRSAWTRQMLEEAGQCERKLGTQSGFAGMIAREARAEMAAHDSATSDEPEENDESDRVMAALTVLAATAAINRCRARMRRMGAGEMRKTYDEMIDLMEDIRRTTLATPEGE